MTRMFGTAVFSIVNLIFIVESMSTLDSTFTSVAKLLGPEFMGILEHGKPASPQNATRRWGAATSYLSRSVTWCRFQLLQS